MTVAGSTAALGLLIAFVFCEKRSPEPLIPLVLFQQRLVGVATLQGMLTGMAVFGALSFTPLFAQSVLGASPTQGGVVLTPFILAWVVTGPVGGRLLLRHGYRWVTAVGMVPLVAGSVLLTQVSAHTTRGQLMVAVILMGVGGGLTAPVQTIAVQHAVASSPHRRGHLGYRLCTHDRRRFGNEHHGRANDLAVAEPSRSRTGPTKRFTPCD